MVNQLKDLKPICPYCGKEARLVSGLVIYTGRSDLENKFFWACFTCDAHVGTHESDNRTPLGRLANPDLRARKMEAHAAFDPMWQRKIEREACSKKEARDAGYKWLAAQMKIPVKDCHIGMFDVDQCKQVVKICSTWHRKTQ